jgi:hypothetical protein
MIAKGSVLYAVVRDDLAAGCVEVLACGQNAAFLEAKMDDYRFTSSGKRRKVARVRLIVEEVVEEYEERPVKE